MESKYADTETPRNHPKESKYEEAEIEAVEESKDGNDNKVTRSIVEDEHKDEEVALIKQSSIFGTDQLVQRLVEFWGGELADVIAEFLDKHIAVFEELGNIGTEEVFEHKLVYSKIHKRYEDLVEQKLEKFRKKENLTPKILFDRLRNAGEQNELAGMIIQLVLSCVDYVIFIDIMRMRVLNRRAAGSLDEDESRRCEEIESKS